MTTLTAQKPQTTIHRPSATHKLSFSGLVASEWIKLTSLRSTWLISIITILTMAGFAGLMAWGTGSMMADEAGAGGFPLHGLGAMVISSSAALGQLMAAALGALFIAGEYSTGMIRSTMAAAPKRSVAIAAKSVVVGGFMFITGIIAAALSYLVTYPTLNSLNATLDLGIAQTWRVLMGVGLYLALIALFALGVGLIMRNPAGAITTALAVLLVLPIIVQILESWFPWAHDLFNYLPTSTGERIMVYETGTGDPEIDEMFVFPSPLSPWQGIGVLAAYVAVTVGVGIALLKKRDV